MPDLPDINTRWPDLGHEAIRQAVVAAIADLANHVEQLADSFLLGQTAADFAQTVLTNFTTLQQTVTDQAGQITTLQQTVTTQGGDITTLQSQVADLQTRVTALEQANQPPPATA